ncbi:MAG: ribonuclease Y [Candidatus Gastranaerophilales bacterium]|nr:ribonuclease Y [Candidatus Gastranaerophilales bacterium]
MVLVCAVLTLLFVRQKAKVEVLEKNEQKYIEDFKEKEQFLKKEALISAKEQLHQERMELDEMSREKKLQFEKIQQDLSKKEDELDSKYQSINDKQAFLDRKQDELEKKEDYLADTIAKQITELERVAQMSRDEAKTMLLNQLKDELAAEQVQLIRENEAKIKETAEEQAREILSQTMQKCAIEQVIETSVSVVSLPSDEMKGRIIGREGRNIRTLETLTGVDLIIDDTPEAVVLSSFDPVRREIAKLTIEKLIQDGRIHPVRIEEVYEKSVKEIENKIKQEGERAAVDLGIMNLNKELSKTLGRLYYRTSYGQNVLKHSIEVGQIAGMLAAELGSDVKSAKRAGLLHDIGKAVDQEQEGTHVQLGVDLCRRFGEKENIIHAIEAHHDDVPCNTLTDALVKIADTISAGRPGARRDTLEIYIKRLKKLEEIANSYEGIKQSFAVSAGREVRVVVQPNVFDDVASAKLARDIAKRIEDELEYPGQIRVTVVREARVTEIAK